MVDKPSLNFLWFNDNTNIDIPWNICYLVPVRNDDRFDSVKNSFSRWDAKAPSNMEIKQSIIANLINSLSIN